MLAAMGPGTETALAIGLVIESEMARHPSRASIRSIFEAVYSLMEREQLSGGCHMLSALAHALLREADVANTLNAGWVEIDLDARHPHAGAAFVHSWVEIDDRPFDVAIERANRISFRRPAVICGIDARSRLPVDATYGAPRGRLDPETHRIGAGTIASWMSTAPSGWADLFWARAAALSLEVGGGASAEELRGRQGGAAWTLRA
jgi:hypothetical protein